MKKTIYIFILSGAYFLFTSNAGGPINVQQTGYTGAPIDQSSTCNACHGGGNYGASAKIEVFDATGTTAVTSYQLNKLYTVRFTISTTSGNPAGYGFQMIDLRQSNNVNVKGFLSANQQPSGIGLNTLTATGNIYVEHTSRLTSKVFNLKWQSPSTNLGTIVFYAAANAVNGNGDTSGDQPTSGATFQLAAAPTGTEELSKNISINVSPNPTPALVSVTLDSKVSKTMRIQVTDVQGRIVLSRDWAVTTGLNTQSLDMQTFSKGIYMIQVIDDHTIASKKIIKI